MKLFKRFIIGILFTVFALNVSSADDDISIIPESNWNAASIVENINQWWKVREKYKEQSKTDMSLWDQFATWVMTWDTILDYCVYLIKFLWELALFVWAAAIIYIWYKKAVENLEFWKSPLWHVVIWIVVVICAYVIVKLLWSAFIS